MSERFCVLNEQKLLNDGAQLPVLSLSLSAVATSVPSALLRLLGPIDRLAYVHSFIALAPTVPSVPMLLTLIVCSCLFLPSLNS